MAKSQALQQKPEEKPGKPDPAKIMEQVMMKGDLSELTPEQRVTYYNHVCHSLKLNPFTKPFDFLEVTDETGKKKIILYANKDCATQLKANHDVSIFKLEEKIENNCLVITAYARTPDGREDIDQGVVSIQGVMAKNLANAHMKAVTKAKRRVTLSICGLGFLDESEVDSIPGARRLPSSEEEATMTEAERQALIVQHKTSGLDQWRCTQESGSRQLAMELIKVCDALEKKGVDPELMRQRLPGGVASRKDLTAAQAEEATKAYQHWLKSYDEVVEGEVIVNG